MPKGKKISKDKILKDLERVANKLNKDNISLSDYDKHGKYGSRTVRDKFETWNKAKEKVNLTNNSGGERYSRKEIVDKVQEISDKYFDGQKIMREHLKNNAKFCISTIIKKYGSMENFCEKEDFDYITKQSYTKEDLIDEMQRIADKIGKQPSKKEMNKHGYFSVMPYRVKFGSYGKALEKAGFSNNIPDGPNNKRNGTTLQYGNDWEKKRNKCLRRDEFACRLCKNKENLLVHHIKPRYKFIQENKKEHMNNLDNLITLCNSCHGKVEGTYEQKNDKEFEKLCKSDLGIENTKDKENTKRSVFDY